MKTGAPGTQASQTLFSALAEGLPAVLLAGRVNVGKSTLFNRIARGARAISSPVPGTTRDLNFARARSEEREFVVVDSGGLELAAGGRMPEGSLREALGALGVADLVVMLFDGRAGFSAADQEALSLVRRTGCPLILAVNKIDRPGDEARAAEFYAMGAQRLFFISAAHGNGVAELLDEIAARLPAIEAAAREKPDLKVALIGRPNVGKSSLLNRLCGFARAVVDETPGTTRDAIDVGLVHAGRRLLLIDTAGIRRPTRIEGELEQAAVARALKTIRRADVVVLVADASEGITDQDARLASLVERAGRAMVVVCNKWDLAAKQGRRVPAFVRDAHARYPFLEYAAIAFTSALTGDGVERLAPAALAAGEAWRATFQTARLNRVLAEAAAAMDAPLIGRKRLNLMYVTQIGTSPPRLAFFANLDRDIPPYYRRFLEARFRKALGLTGTPLRLEFRAGGGRTPRKASSAAARSGAPPRG